jgi:hypothetical protein
MTILSWVRQSALATGFAGPVGAAMPVLRDPTSPDAIIAAAIVESFAKDFDQWCEVHNHTKRPVREKAYMPPHTRLQRTQRSFEVKNLTKNLTLKGGWNEKIMEKNYRHYVYDIEFGPLIVNGNMPLDAQAGEYIIRHYFKAKDAHQQLQQAALQAKANMEANERKWNLVEELMGMKRNGMGQLVPVQEIKEKPFVEPKRPVLVDPLKRITRAPELRPVKNVQIG